MRKGWHITAHDINSWADREPRRAQEELPLLVAKLILASTKPNNIRIPSGNTILLKGWDGILEVEEGSLFVPSGLSAWEFGTSRDVKRKANEDYRKRCDDPRGVDKTNTTFIFVTSRIWEDKDKWKQEKNAEGEWKQVKVLDAVDLETWLHQCPAIHSWFARRMGKRPEGAFDIEQAWDNWRFATEPPSNEDLAIAGRIEAGKNIIQKLKDNSSVIRVFGESKDEAYAFILASIIKNAKELVPRVLVIKDPDEWLSIIESNNPLILIPMFDDSISLRLAIEKGHRVIVPESNPQNRKQIESLVLSKPNKQSLINALIEMGIDREKAWDMVKATRGFLMPLRRLLGNSEKPRWAQSGDSMPLITALLIGAWDEKNNHDKGKVEKLAGKPYNEIERILHTWSVKDDLPVRKVGRIWQVVSRQDMWQLLAPFITTQTLENFGKIAVEVLRELDPRYKLKPEERWLANIYGKVFKHSETIRKHIAEMLAMLAAYGDKDLKNIGESTIQDNVSIWVRKIFDNVSPHIWYSLRNLLPYIAEASPEVFLELVEEGLNGEQPPLMELFKEEDDFSGCPHAGLLWALEGISWNIDYMPQVILILGKLSRLNFRGRCANSPFNTLKNIFLPWYPQTQASVKEKLELLDLLLTNEPEIGWKLLLALIPKGIGGTAIPIHKPFFRDWAEGWKPEVTQKDDLNYILGISEKIEEYASKSLETRLIDLIGILEYLPHRVFDSIIENLKAKVNSISPEKWVDAYEKLFEIICKHRKFPNAQWVLPEEAIAKLEELLQRFTPEDLVNKNKFLFDTYDIVCQPDIEYAKEERIIEERRKLALEEIWKKQGLDGIIQLMKNTKLPNTIVHSLPISSFSDEIEDILLQWLDSDTKEFSIVAQSYISTKFNQDTNYPQIIFEKYKTKWDANKWAKFCLSLPFTQEVIEFTQNLPSEVEEIYWKNIRFFYLPNSSKEQAEWIIRKLLENDRPVAALNAASQYLHTIAKKSNLDVDLLAEILKKVATDPKDSAFERIDSYEIKQIFDYLQQSSEISLTRLALLEWLYIPYFWYNKSHSQIRPITLIKEVLDNPNLFVQLIRWAFKANPPIEGEFSDLSPEQREKLAKNAYFLLDLINELPGQSGNGINSAKLMEWITQVREECEQANRLPICDKKIGEILSYAPAGEDGIWPHETVREVIENINSRDIEWGIKIGVFNQRGVVIKPLGGGGKQERELAERYNQFANKLNFKWPRTAAMLRRMAQGYLRDANREDFGSELNDLL